MARNRSSTSERGNAPLGSKYLDAATSRTDLAKRLKEVWEHLTTLSQDDRPTGLEGSTKALGSSRILDHTDKDVRLYTACALAEILRIYAPEAPFSSPVLLQGFALITAQLRSLVSVPGKQAQAAAACGHKPVPVLYLLHSLATVKSCIILSELVQQDLPRAEEELVDFFSCLLRSVREDHPLELQEQILDVLTACLAELEVVPQALLDTVLLCLLPEHKAESSPSYQLTQLFVARCFAELNPPVTAFINQVLTGKGCGVSEIEEEHVHPLIYELHKVNPNFMLYIFPNVATQLAAEDPAVRARAVALFGRLFAALHADYGNEYPRIFREFLGRFKDKDASIRAQVLGIGAVIMQRKPKLVEQVAPLLAARLQDPEWEIRAKTVREVCQTALQSIELVSKTLLKEVGGRLADRKPQVRLEVIRGLATLYAAYISRTWSEAERLHDSLPQDLEEKLGWIPGTVLLGYSLPDSELRLSILQVFDEVMLPKAADCQVRTTGLLFMWHRLTADANRALRAVLQDQAMVQALVNEYLAARSSWRADMDDELREVRLQECGEALLEAVPVLDRRASSTSLPLKLNETKDQQAPKLLQTIVDPRQPSSRVLKARDDLAAKVGSKSVLGEYVRVLARRATSCFANQETLADLIQLARELLENGEGGDEEENTLEGAVALTELLIESFPVLMSEALPQLLMLCWTAGKEENLQVRLLRLVATRAKGARYLADMKIGHRLTNLTVKGEAEMLSNFRQGTLKVVLKNGSTKASRLAVSALCELVPDPDDAVYARLLRELTSAKSLSLDNPRLEAMLRALAVLAERHPRTFETHAARVRAFALRKMLLYRASSNNDSDDESASGALPQLMGSGKTHNKKKQAMKDGSHSRGLSEECTRACAAIKFLVAHVLGLRAEYAAMREDSVFLPRSTMDKADRGRSPRSRNGDRVNKNEDSRQLRDDDGERSSFLNENSSLVEVSQDELEASASEVLDLLYEILKAEGRLPSRVELSKKDKARLRIVSAGGILKLMRNQYVQHRLLDAPRWRSLAWVMLDPEEITVAGAFTRKLARAVRSSRVHLKFLALLSLAALEEDVAARREARQAVTRAVQNLRQAYEEYMAGQEEEPSEEAKRKVTTSMMPEYLLPYLLHLLAHFPDFPTSPHDSVRWRPIQRCLAFVLEPLMATLGTEADNLSFLLLMTDTILTRYKDASAAIKMQEKEKNSAINEDDVATERLHQVTHVCREFLRSKIKTQENLQAYPGKIYLPLRLYAPQTGRPRTSVQPEKQRGEDRTESTKSKAGKLDGNGEDEEVNGDRDGPNWGLSPIATEISTTGTSVLSQHSSRKCPKPTKEERMVIAGDCRQSRTRRFKRMNEEERQEGASLVRNKKGSGGKYERMRYRDAQDHDEDMESRPLVRQRTVSLAVSVLKSGKEAKRKQTQKEGHGVADQSPCAFDYDTSDDEHDSAMDEGDEAALEEEQKLREAREAIEAQKSSRADRALKRRALLEDVIEDKGASQENDPTFQGDEMEQVAYPISAQTGKGKRSVRTTYSQEEKEENPGASTAAKRRKRRALG
ncbi:hypothetical protein NSK_003597 [Nannochloropsis salina CCMP1776]|uniref:Sister chromatid cohesion protein n=1 Tax=Nannochloropsis salina CCMP1776 TaxID=1027361 RepID=A0A4D9D2G2_9STRA|nr:hypothetical protein NSK_003597 [Nannochloropsis salina CCMP1776]|eukprot:TFJ85174.1 hypothetical protein NSK_003597 [Nannochloropsis salina CCMP1776]